MSATPATKNPAPRAAVPATLKCQDAAPVAMPARCAKTTPSLCATLLPI